MGAKKFFWFVPNTITSFNALSGSLAVVFAIDNNLVLAGILIIIAAILDFFDGLSARLLGAYSDMGKELDSLADMISFGLAPAIIAHVLIKNQLMPDQALLDVSFSILVQVFIPFIIVVFSALRLAKFNIDTRQTESFIGLATPPNAMVWASFPFILATQNNTLVSNLIQTPWFIMVLSVVMSLLLVSELPMFSLKFKNLKLVNNKMRFAFLAICILLLMIFNIVAIPLIIAVYILLSVIQKLSS